MVNCDTCNIINGINYFQIQIHRYDATKGLFYLIQKMLNNAKLGKMLMKLNEYF